MKPCTLLLVDDHKIITDGIINMLSDVPGIHVEACACSGSEALRVASSLSPDVIITDISMPDMNGIELTRAITAKLPAAKVIVLTMYTHDDFIFSAIRAGARAVLSKQDTSRDVLLEAISEVSEGREYFSPGISKTVMKTLMENNSIGSATDAAKKLSLTTREKEILKLYADGFSNNEIAEKLFISIRTVETHKNNIMHKYNFKSTVEMVKFALRNNIADL